MAEAVFALDVEAGGVVDGSNAAAGALESLKAKIQGDQAALKELQAQMKLLQSGGAVNIAQFKQLKEQIGDKQNAVRKSSTEYSNLGGKLSELGKSVKSAGKEHDAFGRGLQGALEKTKPLSKSFAELGEHASKLGSPIGLGSLGPMLSGIGAAMLDPITAIAVLSVALIAAGVAAAYLAVKAAVAVTEMADLARTNRIFLGAVAGSEAAGAKLGDMLGDVAKKVPITAKALQDIAVTLSGKGLKDNDLEHSLLAISRATAVLGAGAGQKLQSVVEKSKDLKKFMAKAVDFEGSGITLDDVARSLAARTKTSFAVAKAAIQSGSVDLSTGLQALDAATESKLGGASDKMKLSLSSIGERASQVFGSMFDDLDIEPILKGLSSIVELFDQDSAEGSALREIVKTIFQPLFEVAGGTLFDAIIGYIDNTILGAQQLVIWALEAKNSIVALARDPVGELDRLGGKLYTVGARMIDGIVQGIKAQGPKIKAALIAEVSRAVTGVDIFAMIHSPSMLMHERGVNLVRGTTEGIEDEGPAVEKALVAVTARATDATKVANDNTGGKGSSQGATIMIGELHVNGVKGADDPSFEAKLTEVLMRVIATSAAPEPA